MKDNAYEMVKASLAADSLALGAHWIYDTDQIRSEYGRVDQLIAPGLGTYHPTKQRGEFTHYGDQTLTLLESVARVGKFDPAVFFQDWQALFRNYSGYLDTATKSTLRNIVRGKNFDESGSVSNDIAGAARIVPIVLVHRDDPKAVDDAARIQTRMTHNDDATIETAAFFARVCLSCLDGTPPSKAVQDIAENEFANSTVEMWALQGLDAADRESLSAVAGFGQSCHTPEAFSGVVQIIARYEDNPGEGIVEAVMAGGDNAARAAIVAQVLAAWNGADDAVNGWFDQLVRADRIRSLLDLIP